jgi:hypothetical protein
MADVRPHPHDVMVHAVLSDVAEATGFLRVFCPAPSHAVRRMRGAGQKTRDTKDVITRWTFHAQ